MEDWHQIIKSIAVTAENTTTVARLLVERAVNRQQNQELSGYKQRVRNRKKVNAFRPDWELIGRVVFDHEGNRTITEMDQVPQTLQDTMNYLINHRRIKPGPDNAFETQDGEYRYLLEIAIGWPLDNSQIFAFWKRPF